MRVARAIDKFLGQMQLEHDWTARSIRSYYVELVKLVIEHPDLTFSDLEGRAGTDFLRRHLGKHYGHTAASTRATRISYFHSFFGWAEAEGLIEDDPSRRIKRPPSRKPDTYKPSEAEIRMLLGAATTQELPALLMMSGAGLRAHELVDVLWRDLDLTDGKVRVRRKGHNWQWLPVDPVVIDRIRLLYRELEPDHDDHVFVAETEQWESNEHRIRQVIDPKTPRTTKTLWRMVGRVSARAGIHTLGPHMLRRGFANAFLRDTRREFGTADVWTLKLLMGHSRIDTTERYLKDLEVEEASKVLDRLRAEPLSQASPDEETIETEEATVAQTVEWRRRESNPRPHPEKPGTRPSANAGNDKPRLTPDEGGHK